MDKQIFDKLESLTTKEFKELVDYCNYSEMKKLPVEEQKEIKAKLKAEGERRGEVNSVLQAEIVRIDEELAEKRTAQKDMFRLIETGYLDYDKVEAEYKAINNGIRKLKAEKEEIEIKLGFNSKVQNATEGLSRGMNFSIASRKIDNGKKAVTEEFPQKVCKVGKGLLKKIRSKALSLSEKFSEKISNFVDINAQSAKQAEENIDYLLEKRATLTSTGYERLMDEEHINQLLEEQKKRYERMTMLGNIAAELQPGLVRFVKLPSTFVDKLSGKYRKLKEKSQADDILETSEETSFDVKPARAI